MVLYWLKLILKCVALVKFFGTRQSGIPEFQVADIVEDYNILEEARRVASQIVSNPNWRQEPQWQIITQNLKDKGNFD